MNLPNTSLILLLIVSIMSLSSCANMSQQPTALELTGQWLVDEDGQLLLDPQPSGLTFWQDRLVMISDASAADAQIKQLHFFDPSTGKRAFASPQYTIAENLATQCFSQYLQTKPDLEALIKDPHNPNGFITVTEDASVLGELSEACQQQFNATHSTEYPTVLVRLDWDGDNLKVTGTRAVQFPKSAGVGNYPNDGIEGLAYADNTLYLSLEKDSQFRARIFTTSLPDDFWQQSDFVTVDTWDASLPNLHQFDRKPRPHPINGTDIVTHNGVNWLIAAARNDNQLWLIDIANRLPTKVVKLRYLAPNRLPNMPFDQNCTQYSFMDNASLEGVAVNGQDVYLMNDPWKKNYWKNTQCPSTQPAYDKLMSGLLFKTDMTTLFRHARDISAE